MGYFEHENLIGAILDLVTHAPIPDTDSPDSFRAFYLQTSMRPGIRGERQNGGNAPGS
jgi:hypothetical protein